MKRTMLLSATLGLLLSGCGLAGGDTDDQSAIGQAGEIATWCQVDDPGFVEKERINRKLSNGEISKIACPEQLPVGELPNEIILPMPCGRRMVFRSVRLAVSDALDSETAVFGDPNSGDEFRKSMSGPWYGEIAGGFPENANGTGNTTYYIAKYELTAPQYAIFSSGDEEDYGSNSEVSVVRTFGTAGCVN